MCLFRAPLDTRLGSPFFASLSVHGLHVTVYAASKEDQVIVQTANHLAVVDMFWAAEQLDMKVEPAAWESNLRAGLKAHP